MVGIGVTLMDFAADSCDSPVRAFLLDECNSRDQDTGLNVHAFLGGFGAASGYLLTSIDWSDTIFTKAIGKNHINLVSASKGSNDHIFEFR